MNKKVYIVVFLFILIITTAFELKNSNFFTKRNLKKDGSVIFIHPIRVANAFFTSAFAVSDEERVRGLSGIKALPENSAMFFVFPKNDAWGIWMKDMNFPIDIIWVDENKKVSFWKENVTPETYPEVFYPPVLERYVIELPAGTIKKEKIRFGDEVIF